MAGAAIFAAFPGVVRHHVLHLLPGPCVVLVALIVRGVSFEFHRKIDNPRWRSTWRWSLTIGSLLIPLLLGTALGDLLHGLPIDSAHNYTGTFFGLLVPFGLYTGVTLTVLSPVPRGGLPDPQDRRRAPRPGGQAVRPPRLGGRGRHLRLADLDPCGARRGFRSRARSRPWLWWRWSARPGWPSPGRKAGPSPPRPQPSAAWSARSSSSSSPG